jgi:manganese-dependent ADP-ribose/CDP-alcohol diphosphatase
MASTQPAVSQLPGLPQTVSNELTQTVSQPLFSVGLIADIQYADIADGTSYDGREVRRFRNSLACARQSVAAFQAHGCSTVVQLGDLLDGKNNAAATLGIAESASAPTLAAAATALAALSSDSYALLHVRGNQLSSLALSLSLCTSALSLTPLPPCASPPCSENYCFSAQEQHALLAMPASCAFPDLALLCYSYSPHPGWLFLVLDAYDVSIARPRGSAEFLQAQALLKANNPNPTAWFEDPALKGDFFKSIRNTPAARFVPFNGALGSRQLQWLADSLASAKAQRQRALVFSHIPFSPSSASASGEPDVFSTLVWNSAELNAVLAPFAGSTVAAVFCGHNHGGSFGREGGIPHITLPSPLIHPQGSHAIVEVHADRLQLHLGGAAQHLVDCIAGDPLPLTIPLAPLEA